MSDSDPNARTRRGPGKNGRVAIVLASLVFGMVGLSFAAVPLYDLFCRVTGFGGTTQIADALPDEVGSRTVTVRFDAMVDEKLPWAFGPEERSVSVRPGEPGLVFYTAENMAEETTVGTAVFNVTPPKAGRYFHKVQCFCFEEQAMQPGQSERMGVSFFVDPAIEDDPSTADLDTITLSYTFFRDLEDWERQLEREEQLSQTPADASGDAANAALQAN
jgi:cytochrome c oxidase assembly protein subunit 11